MAYINNERICDFANINQYYMTLAEMAHELSITPTAMGRICDALGIVPITIRERTKEFILRNQHLTQEEIAAKLCVTKENIVPYIKELGIEILTNFQKSLKIKEEAEAIKPERPTHRYKTVYTQTGTDLSDRLKGITTTNRVQVRTSDYFFR